MDDICKGLLLCCACINACLQCCELVEVCYSLKTSDSQNTNDTAITQQPSINDVQNQPSAPPTESYRVISEPPHITESNTQYREPPPSYDDVMRMENVVTPKSTSF